MTTPLLRPRSRRDFLRVAGLGSVALATGQPAFGDVEQSQDVEVLRQTIASYETQLEAIWANFEAAGFPFENATPPMSEAQIEIYRQQAETLLLDLGDELRGYADTTLQKLVLPECLPLVRVSESYDLPLIAPRDQLVGNIMVPANLAGTEAGSIGYVILMILIEAVLGLDKDDLEVILKSGLLAGLLALVKELWDAFFKPGSTPKQRRESLRAVLKGLAELIEKLAGRLSKHAIDKLRKAAASKLFGLIGILILLGISIYKNWEEIKQHI